MNAVRGGGGEGGEPFRYNSRCEERDQQLPRCSVLTLFKQLVELSVLACVWSHDSDMTHWEGGREAPTEEGEFFADEHGGSEVVQ